LDNGIPKIFINPYSTGVVASCYTPDKKRFSNKKLETLPNQQSAMVYIFHLVLSCSSPYYLIFNHSSEASENQSKRLGSERVEK